MRHIIVVDIDGTIAKVGDRLKYLQQDKKDWDAFYEHCDEDKPFMDMMELVSTLEQDYVIIFCTGRRESVREKTEEWIDDHFGYDFTYHLFMRPDGDHRHDTEVKPELLANAGVSPKEVLCILEDRDSMVAKWRELGYRCLQVDRGDF